MIGVLAVVFLALSFVFSGVEAGLLSLNRVRLRHLARQGDPAARRLQRLLLRPTELFVTVLVVTNLLNITVIVVITNRLVGRFGPWGYVWALLLALPFFLFVIEFCAKSVFRRLGYRALSSLALLLEGATFLLSPLILVCRPLARLVLRQRPARGMFVAREDLKQLTIQNERLGTLSSVERQMIHNVVDFRTVRVGDVMTTLAQTRCVSAQATVAQVVALSRQTRAERFPVQDATGRVVGLVNVIDLVVDRQPTEGISPYVRRIVTVRASDPAPRVLRRLRATPQHFALVLDDAGRAVGVVGARDLLNPLVRLSPEKEAGEKGLPRT